MLNFTKKASIVILYCVFLFVILPEVQAQEKQGITASDYGNEAVEMADVMRANGKIYVVIATIASVMGGFIFYLVTLDRKIAKFERQIKN